MEFWLEKDALAGVLYPLTAKYDVPLMIARGYSSLSFLHSAAEAMADQYRPCFVYHLGDLDPSGVDAAEFVERTLREMAPKAEIHFERLALTEEQVEEWDLPTRPTKKTDTRSKNWKGDSVELDAVHPHQLRQLVQDAIEQHMSYGEFITLKVAEASEQEAMEAWAEALDTFVPDTES